MRSLPVGLLVATVCCCALVYAQDPPVQGPTFRTGVDVISIDVAAVDAQGRPVDGLLAPEFSVKVDGQPRRVVSVQQVKVDVEAARKQAVAEPFESFFSTNITPPEGRLIVIAVDELNIRPGNVRPLLNTAARFVENLSPADRIAFYAYPQPGAYVDFTSDHARIRRAMETVVGNQIPYQSRFNIGLYEAVQTVLKQDELTQAKVYARECRRTLGTSRELCEQEILTEMAQMVAKVREERANALLGLQQLLTRLQLIEGPKSLIVVSEGLILEDATDLDDTIRQAALAQASVHVLMMDVQRGSDVTRGVMPPTMTEDREMQMDGLRELAAASRGTLHNVVGNGELIFARLASELSAYYLLGVEADPKDRDDKAHRIDVEVRRRGITLRSRRAFVLSSPRNTAPAERLSEVLFSPFGVPEVPLRVTTYAMREGTGSKVRLLLAADVGQPGTAAGQYTVGWALIDREGKVAASGGERAQLAPIDGRADAALGYSTPIVVDPGVYSLRFGVVDSTGRRGSVVREVNAWKIQGEEFAVGDLIVSAMPEAGQDVVPRVEPYVSRDLVAMLDVHSITPATLERTTVALEVAEDQDGPTLLTVPTAVVPNTAPTAREVQGVISSKALPPGRYVVRARITKDGQVAGMLSRPFILSPAPGAAASAVFIPPPKLPIPRFERSVVLTQPVLTEILGSLEARSPSLKAAATAARAGQYGAASLEALGSGDQAAAAFLKGLDWFSKGQLDQAAAQFNIAAGPRREFFPAAFYLGATLAAAGRDRDAAATWQLGIGQQPRLALVYSLFADARFRDGQPQSVIDVLQPAWERSKNDDDLARRLATAYILIEKHSDALNVLVPLAERHPDDQDVLFTAIVSQYETTSRAGVSLSNIERDRLLKWARAYRGDQRALIDRYLAALGAR